MTTVAHAPTKGYRTIRLPLAESERLSGNLFAPLQGITQHPCGNETQGDRKDRAC